MTVFISMFIFALIGAISPGPVNIIATSTGANFGFIRALPHVSGATVSYTVIVFLMGIGLNQVLSSVPEITQVLQYLGAGFLLYMSYKIATSGHDINTFMQTAAPTFIEGALSQGLNPKAWLVSMSGVSLFVATNTPPMWYLLAFCLISFTVCFASVATWAALGTMIANFLSTKTRQVSFNVCMGLLLSSSVISIFTNA